MPRTARGLAVAAAAVLAATMLSGCANSAEIPTYLEKSGWHAAYLSDRASVIDELRSWQKLAREAEVEAVYETDGEEYRYTHQNGWTSVLLEGQSVMDRPVASKDDPVTGWKRDRSDGGLEADRVICFHGSCTDVSAWYVLANFDEELGFPDEVAGVAPPELATPFWTNELDPVFWQWQIDSLQEPYSSVTYVDGVSVTHTEKDRVYYLGKARVLGVETHCVAWFDSPEALSSDDPRAPVFCMHPSGISAIDGYNKLISVRTVKHDPTFGPGRHVDLLDAFAAKIAELGTDEKEMLLQMLAVDDGWARRHGLDE